MHLPSGYCARHIWVLYTTSLFVRHCSALKGTIAYRRDFQVHVTARVVSRIVVVSTVAHLEQDVILIQWKERPNLEKHFSMRLCQNERNASRTLSVLRTLWSQGKFLLNEKNTFQTSWNAIYQRVDCYFSASTFIYEVYIVNKFRKVRVWSNLK